MSLAARFAVHSRLRRTVARCLAPLLLLAAIHPSLAGQATQPPPPASSTTTGGRLAAGNPAWKCQVDPGLASTYGAASRACDAQFRAASIRAALIDGQSLGTSAECALRMADQVERAIAAWAAADTAAAIRTERVDCDGRVLTVDSLSVDARALLHVCPGKIWSWVDRGGAGQSCAKLRDFVVSSRTKGSTPAGAANDKDARRAADLMRDAREWYVRGDFSRARDLSRRAMTLDAANALAHAVLGASLSMLGEHGEAERQLRNAVGIDATNGWAWGMLAQTLYFARNDSAVVTMAHDALAVDGGNAEVLGFLGMSELRLSRNDDAVKTLTRATSLAPKDARFRASLSRALRLGGHNEEAEASAREAIRLQPDYYAGYAELGQILEASGRKSEALVAYRRAHQLAEWDSETAEHLVKLEKP